MTKKLYFEDLHVGQRLHSKSVTIDAQEIIRFARDNDPQFFHLDEEAAEEGMFHGLVASGWQTAALTIKLLLDSAEPPFAGGVVGADAHVSWKRPVRPGDRLRVESEITHVAASPKRADRGFVAIRATTFNQKDEIVLTIASTLAILRDPARAIGAGSGARA